MNEKIEFMHLFWKQNKRLSCYYFFPLWMQFTCTHVYYPRREDAVHKRKYTNKNFFSELQMLLFFLRMCELFIWTSPIYITLHNPHLHSFLTLYFCLHLKPFHHIFIFPLSCPILPVYFLGLDMDKPRKKKNEWMNDLMRITQSNKH